MTTQPEAFVTVKREVLEQALEAIELNWKTDEGDAVKPLLRAALEQPGVEPVAYIHRNGDYWEVSERYLLEDEKERGWTEEPLYTAPPDTDKLLRQVLADLEAAPFKQTGAITAIRKHLGEE